MNKKKQQEKQQKNCNLLHEFYSRLNITWLQKPDQSTSNPILKKTENNLMSKSIAHKICNSKKYKLNKTKQTQRKESAHAFTNIGIVSNYTQHHQRRKSQPAAIIKIETKENRTLKFLKYENSNLCKTSKLQRFSQSCALNDQLSKMSASSLDKQSAKSNRTFRAMSAHLSSRKPRIPSQDQLNMRKTSENWLKRDNRKEQRYEVKGWDIDLDNLDINIIDLRMNTQM